MIEQVGNMIYELRQEAGMKQQMLSYGLLSIGQLSKVERGEHDLDGFTANALFQRLGKSMEQFEMVISKEEYERMVLRVLIQETMCVSECERVEELLEEYETITDSKRTVHVQYVQMYRAILRYVLHKEEIKEAIVMLEDALRMTTVEPMNEETWELYGFCVQEIQLMLLIAYLKMETGDYHSELSRLVKLHEYIDKNYTSEEIKIQVYPQCCYLLATAYKKLGDREKATQICKMGLDCVISRRSFIFVEELMRLYQDCEDNTNYQKELEAIAYLYKVAKYERPEDMILRLMLSTTGYEIMLSHEIVHEIRIAKGWSQENLSDDFCTRETMCKLERGQRPTKRILDGLFDRMGMERKKYHSYVVTSDYRTYEVIKYYKRHYAKNSAEENEAIIAEIEKRLNMDKKNIANQQFLEMAKLMCAMQRKEYTYDEALEKLTKILKYTMHEFKGEVYCIPTREEYIILNYMALCLKRSGRKEEAINLYEMMLQKYKSSEVRPENHASNMRLLYNNYLAALEESDYLEYAEQIGQEGLEFSVKTQRAEMSLRILANLVCVYEKQKMDNRDELCVDALKCAIWLFKLYDEEKDATVTQKHLLEKHQVRLD